MRFARIMIVLAAFLAGAVAYVYIVRQRPVEGAPAPVVIEKSAPEYLVASRLLERGSLLADNDLRWQRLSNGSVPAGAISRESPSAGVGLVGALLREEFAAGAPITAGSLIRPGEAGYLAASLSTGMRAIAISIDRTGVTTAGGIIGPNDRVDIIQFAGAAAGLGPRAQTVLQDIRVLAVGSSAAARPTPATPVVSNLTSADTVTFEVTVAQAEILTLMQHTGRLTLALRSPREAKREAIVDLKVIHFGGTAQIERPQ